MKKIIFAIIAIILIAVGAYLILNRSGSSGEATGNEPLEYVRHTSKDFSFEYPKGWFVNDATDTTIFPRVGLTNYDPNLYVTAPHATGKFFKFELVKYQNMEGFPLREWIDDHLDTAALNDAKSDVLNTLETTVAGLPAITLVARVRGVTYEAVYTSRNESVYEFTFGGPIHEEFRPIFEQILKTFRFNSDHAE